MDKFLSELKNTASKVVRKSSELVEISKIKLNIANVKSDISANYKLLGELVYLSQTDDAEPDTEKIQETIARIDELNEKLSALLEDSSALKNEKVCPECAKNNAKDALFCVKCGHKFEEPFEEADEDNEEPLEGDVL